MDPCFIDLTVEFLAVVFHSILYYTEVYPRSIFESRRKYGIVVYKSIHPEVNQYLDLCLKSITECFKSGTLNRIEFLVTNEAFSKVLKFVFHFNKGEGCNETADVYLVQCEQNLRAFCLQLVAATSAFQELPEDLTFSINIHTNESSAVSLATNPDLEDFPLVETEKKTDRTEKIIPLKSIQIRNFNMDTYIEI